MFCNQDKNLVHLPLDLFLDICFFDAIVNSLKILFSNCFLRLCFYKQPKVIQLRSF